MKCRLLPTGTRALTLLLLTHAGADFHHRTPSGWARQRHWRPPSRAGVCWDGVSAALALLQILGYEQCLCAPPLLLLLGALHVPSPREGTAGCCSSRGWPRCSPLGCDNVTAAQSPRRRPQLCQRAGGWGWGWAGPNPFAREGRRAPARPSHCHSPSLAALTSFLSGSSAPLIHPGQMAASRGLFCSTRGARGCGGAAAQGSSAAAAAPSPPKMSQCGPPICRELLGLGAAGAAPPGVNGFVPRSAD